MKLDPSSTENLCTVAQALRAEDPPTCRCVFVLLRHLLVFGVNSRYRITTPCTRGEETHLLKGPLRVGPFSSRHRSQ